MNNSAQSFNSKCEKVKSYRPGSKEREEIKMSTKNYSTKLLQSQC